MPRCSPHLPEAACTRRDFLIGAGVAGLAVALPDLARGEASDPPASLVGDLYESLTPEQRSEICFDWDHVDGRRGLLRSRVEPNWKVTSPEVNSGFYSPDQRAMIRGIFEGITDPGWHERFDRQLRDDAGGFGEHQAVAIFGEPGSDRFQFVLTGRHMTLRCDGNSAEHVAFGGPIFYGHAAGPWWLGGFFERADHDGNVFWSQALAANELYGMLDGRQREAALLAERPEESAVHLRGVGVRHPGIPIAQLSPDQRLEAQRVLGVLLEPFRQSDRDEVVAALRTQGGLDACSLAFYSEGDIGGDGIWDCFRLEGPAFAWYFRGSPHVHVWVHVADSPHVDLNARA